MEGTTLRDGGDVVVSGGGQAWDTLVGDRGVLFVRGDGAEAWKTTVNVGGLVDVASGGTASILFNPWQGEVNSNTGATVLFLVFLRD